MMYMIGFLYKGVFHISSYEPVQ